MTDLIERLRAVNPVPDCEPPPIDDVWRKLDALDGSGAAASPDASRRAARGLSRVGRHARQAAIIALCVVPAAIVIAFASRVHQSPLTPGGAAEMRPGQFWYTKSTETYVYYPDDVQVRNAPPVMLSSTYEMWIGRDGGGRDLRRYVAVSFLSRDHDLRGVPAVGSSTGGPLTDPTISGPLSIGYEQMLALPTKVDALTRMLDGAVNNELTPPPNHLYAPPTGALKRDLRWRKTATCRCVAVFMMIDSLLDRPSPEPLRASLYRVLARIPGIQLLGLTHDRLGRPALAVALTGHLEGLGPGSLLREECCSTREPSNCAKTG